MTLFNTTLITLFTDLIHNFNLLQFLDCVQYCCAFQPAAIAVLVVRHSVALFAVVVSDERVECFAPILRFLFWHVPA